MKDILRKIMLGLMLLVALSVCGTIVLKIFEVILHIEFENVIYEGFKVGLLATIVLLLDSFRKMKTEV